MRLNINIILAILGCCFIFGACGDETFEPTERSFDYEYYPLEVGHSWTYRMDSTVVSGGGNTITASSSYLKEEIINEFVNLTDDTTYVISVSKSQTIDGNYVSSDNYQVIKTGSRVTRYEENLGFIKMFFPITKGDTIDANLFDHLININVGQDLMKPYKDWEFTVIDDRMITTVNGRQYTEVAHLQQANHENPIEIRASQELYAPQIGMIRREMTIFDSQCGSPCDGLPWLEKTSLKGFSLVQTLVDHNF